MENQLIPAQQFCVHYNIEVQFLNTLQDYGLLRVTTVNETAFIDAEDLSNVEKIVHLHQDLDINLEGIDAILQLLKRLQQTEDQLALTQARLRIYER